MLWINMVMDTLAGVAYSYEPPLDSYMLEPPKKIYDKRNTYNRFIYEHTLYGIFKKQIHS